MCIIQAACLDLGDTLVERNPELDQDSILLIYAALGKSKPSGDDMLRLRRRMKAIENAAWNSYSPTRLLRIQTLEAEYSFLRDEFYPAVLGRWGLHEPTQSLLSELARRQLGPTSFRCFSDVKDALARLKSLGLRLAIVSNALPSAEGILQYLGLWDSFDCLMLSYRSECLKPNCGIHHMTLKSLNVDGKNAIFIDDRVGFVTAARGIYKQSILIDRDDSYSDEDVDKIKHLGELFAVLEQKRFVAGQTGIPFAQLPLFMGGFLRFWAKLALGNCLRYKRPSVSQA